MKLLLLSCCAPCSCAVIAYLAEQKKDFTVLFYNPNITPESEYQKRLSENKRVCDHFGVPFVELPYQPQVWVECTKGLENEPERGQRCSACFELRLRQAMLYAKANGFDVVTSVLGFSRYKDLDQVNAAAAKMSKETGVPYDTTNWRKGPMQALQTQLIRELNIYRQNYCGCAQSLKSRKG